MRNSIKYIVLLSSCTFIITSCVKTQKCECTTSSIAYDPNGSAYDKLEITSFSVKGTKSENKTQCDVIKSGQPQDNGYTTTCEVKK